jgi:hypothetical protein
MIPKAVHICHIITSAPRTFAGAHSAEYMGTVVLLGPMPSPRTKRAAKRCGQEFVTPDQKQVSQESVAVTKMAPRRPRRLFSGAVSQQPRIAQHS